ncbi:MAG: chromosomal replication initiator protein DnaA [bacterium]|nr:chromosomal replication initiator protein DnaA [bacterium]
MDNKQLWENALVEIEMSVSKANFSTWFKDTYVLKREEGVVFLSVPNAFVKTWLLEKYHKFILKSLRNLSDSIRSIDYTVAREDGKNPINDSKRYVSGFMELPLNEFMVDKENNLNPRYTFESFVVGPFNELAHAAAQAIIKKPGIVYNPLFIYGNTGHGKTHLIQAIGNHIKKVDISKKIYYITSERFAVDFVNALQNGKANQFKDKYRGYDVIIMDDIQFFSNKEKVQEELFHLFNSMYDNNKQIVFSSDKHPNFIPDLENRLKSRFSQGMIVDIPAPDIDSRAAILRRKLQASNLSLNAESIDFLSSVMESNIRELEGIVNSIICQMNLKGRELTINEVRQLVKNNSKPKKNIAIKDVVKIVADFYNIEESSIYEKTRRKEIVKPRQITMYILREECNVSYPLIGQKLGGRDHTTVIHSCEKIKNEIKDDHILAQEVSQIKTLI